MADDKLDQLIVAICAVAVIQNDLMHEGGGPEYKPEALAQEAVILRNAIATRLEHIIDPGETE